MEKVVEHNKANEYCEKHHHGKLLEVVGKKFPETLKNVYDPELMKETWIFNKVGTSSYTFHTLQNCLKFLPIPMYNCFRIVQIHATK